MQTKTKKAWIPHLIAVGVFLVLSSAYFPPAFQGKVLRQGDIISWVGMSQAIQNHRAAHGEEPLWTWSMFSGMPAYQISMRTYGNVVGYFQALIHVFPRPPFYFLLLMVSFYILMMSLRVRPYVAMVGAIGFAFATFFMVSMEAGHTSKIHATCYMPAVIAGLVYAWRSKYLVGAVTMALALSLQLKANHFQITYYTFMVLGILGVFMLVHTFREKRWPHLTKVVLYAAVGVIFGIASNLTNLITSYEFAKSTIRSKSELTIEADGSKNESNETGGLDPGYITNWSLGIGETWSLLFPAAKGEATGRLGNHPDAMQKVSAPYRQTVAGANTYWGDQPFTAGPVYAGALICLFFLLGAFTVRHWLKWPLIVVTLLSIMLAWGNNLMGFTELFIDYFPMYNKFRSVTMMLIVTQLAMCALATLFLHEFISREGFWEANRKRMYIVSGVLGGLLLLFVLTPDSFFSFFSEQEMGQFDAQKRSNPQQVRQIDDVLAQIEIARISIFKSDALRSFGLVVVGFGLLFAAGTRKLKPEYAIYGLIALVTLDVWLVDKRFLNNERIRGEYAHWMDVSEKEQPFEARAYDLQILNSEIARNPVIRQAIDARLADARQASGKALTAPEQQAVMFATLDTMTNYRVLDFATNTFNNAQSSYFHKTIGGYNAAKLMRYQELIEFHIDRSSGRINQDVLNMLNTRYIVIPTEQQAQVQQNPGALGNAWFVDEVKWVNNPDEEIQGLNDFDPARQAIVNKKYEGKAQATVADSNTQRSVRLTHQQLNRMEYSTTSDREGFVVFSEVYYQPGWQAYLDDQPVEHLQVNFVLRGLQVPAGNHTVTFRFEPSSYQWGERVSLAGSLLILLAALGLLVREFRSKQEA